MNSFGWTLFPQLKSLDPSSYKHSQVQQCQCPRIPNTLNANRMPFFSASACLKKWWHCIILFVLIVLIQNYITILWSVLSQISWPATSGILGPCHHIPWEDVGVYIHIKVHRSHFQHLRRIGIKFLFHTALCKKAVRVDAVWNRNMSPILHNPCVSWRCVL